MTLPLHNGFYSSKPLVIVVEAASEAAVVFHVEPTDRGVGMKRAKRA